MRYAAGRWLKKLWMCYRRYLVFRNPANGYEREFRHAWFWGVVTAGLYYVKLGAWSWVIWSGVIGWVLLDLGDETGDIDLIRVVMNKVWDPIVEEVNTVGTYVETSEEISILPRGCMGIGLPPWPRRPGQGGDEDCMPERITVYEKVWEPMWNWDYVLMVAGGLWVVLNMVFARRIVRRAYLRAGWVQVDRDGKGLPPPPRGWMRGALKWWRGG